MLSQQIGFYAEQIVRGDESAKNTLEELINLHDTSFKSLRDGGVAPGVAGNRVITPAPADMIYLFNDAEQLWKQYKQHAEIILTEQTMSKGMLTPEVVKSIKFIETNAPEMLRRNNEIVKAYVEQNYDKQIRFNLFNMWVLMINVLAIILALMIAKSISRPVEELRAATEKMQKGHFDTRVDIKTGDELERLGEAFNHTTEVLEQMDDEYKEIDRAKTRFLSITSHELRSPLTAMKAQMQMLEKGYFGKFNAKQKEAAEIVLRNTDRLDNILLDFLDISRMEAARLKFEFIRTSLAPHVNMLIEEMEAFLPEKKIKLVLKMGKLPVMEVDPDRTMQVLRNLLNNALKFSPDKSTITVSITREGNHILFSVADEGIGIKKEDQKNLFKPFFQAEQTLYRKYSGTGLGLAICCGIVTCQKGKIWVESEIGKGSTFYFTIPLKPVKQIKPIKVIFSEKEKT